MQKNFLSHTLGIGIFSRHFPDRVNHFGLGNIMGRVNWRFLPNFACAIYALSNIFLEKIGAKNYFSGLKSYAIGVLKILFTS